MKKFLIILALVLAGPKLGWTKIVPENVTVTASDNAGVDVTKNAPWGVGLDGKDHRLAVDNAGRLLGSSSTAAAVTVLTALVPTGMTQYTALSYSATSVNLTTSAGASSVCVVCLSSNGGAAAGFKVQFTTSSVAPTSMTATGQGHYIAASTTAQCWGPFAAGTHLHAIGVAASSSVLVDIQKVQ